MRSNICLGKAKGYDMSRLFSGLMQQKQALKWLSHSKLYF